MESKIYNNLEVIKFLGGCANNLGILNTREMDLNINDFNERFHKIVFATLTTLAKEKDILEVDGVAVDMYLNSYPEQHAIFVANKGMEWLDNAKEMARTSSIEYAQRIIKKYSLLRYYYKLGFSIEEIMDFETTDLEKIELQRRKLDAMDIADIKNHFKVKLLEVENAFKTADDDTQSYHAGEGIMELINQCKVAPKWGLPFQSKLFNTVFRGMLKSKLVIRSADSGGGKSRQSAGDQCNISAIEKYDTKAKCWVKNENAVPSLFISTELMQEEMQLLYLACISGVPEETIKNGKFDGEIEQRIIKAGEVLMQSPIYVEYTSDFSLTSLENLIEEHIIRNGTGYIFFDYIQITPALSQELTKMFGYVPREDTMLALLSGCLKNICNKYGVFILTSTQLNRNYKIDQYIDATHLAGGKATINKADVGVITLSVTKADLEKVQQAIDEGFCKKIPTHKHHVFKNRGGTWNSIVIWVNMNLDNLTITDCFVTDRDFNIIGEINETHLG